MACCRTESASIQIKYKAVELDLQHYIVRVKNRVHVQPLRKQVEAAFGGFNAVIKGDADFIFLSDGMKSCNDPIHISVTTRQTDTASEIIVEDDGPGYNPVDDNEPHIALNNIRERLEMMCKGKLEIALREGGGTVVKVTIPA